MRQGLSTTVEIVYFCRLYGNFSAYHDREELFRVHYMCICGPDGRSRAPMDGFMASHIMDTEWLRINTAEFRW